MTAHALDGIIVADFSRVLAGPYATMLLGDFGADIIKIERPGSGDDTRHWGPPYDAAGVATYFNSVNRNKRSVAIDLATDAGRAQARELVAGADVVVENFRPGTMEKLGLGYDDLAPLRPGLIYCSITGFGHHGGAALPGYDLLVQAVGGLMSVTGDADGPPMKVGVQMTKAISGVATGSVKTFLGDANKYMTAVESVAKLFKSTLEIAGLAEKKDPAGSIYMVAEESQTIAVAKKSITIAGEVTHAPAQAAVDSKVQVHERACACQHVGDACHFEARVEGAAP